MIDQEQLVICKQRGHDPIGLDRDKWRRCKWCGTWQRIATVVETREGDPPENEISPMEKLIARNKLEGK